MHTLIGYYIKEIDMTRAQIQKINGNFFCKFHEFPEFPEIPEIFGNFPEIWASGKYQYCIEVSIN